MRENHHGVYNRSDRLSGLAGGGALAAALAYSLTSVCCLPFALGVGGAVLAAASGFLGPLQPYFAGCALLLVAYALWRAYRPRQQCALATACPPASRRKPLGLWLLAAIVVVLLTMTYWLGWLL
jgi:hypothetical protein